MVLKTIGVVAWLGFALFGPIYCLVALFTDENAEVAPLLVLAVLWPIVVLGVPAGAWTKR